MVVLAKRLRELNPAALMSAAETSVVPRSRAESAPKPGSRGFAAERTTMLSVMKSCSWSLLEPPGAASSSLPTVTLPPFGSSSPRVTEMA